MARSLNLITFITIYAPSVPPPDVFPQQIEGVKMILNKTLSSFFKVTLPFTVCSISLYVMLSHLLYYSLVCLQVSHALHLSAVSPSYYRFHVEHLQSDDYSKDKVSLSSHDQCVTSAYIH